MEITDRGVVASAGEGSRAVASAPHVAALADGSMICSYKLGAYKDDPAGVCEIRVSGDGGDTWSEPSQPFATSFAGVRGSLSAAQITELAPGRLLAVLLWVDREAYPGKPLFNEETEGCLPLTVLLALSEDNGATWGDLWAVDTPDDVGPPSVTSPVLQLSSGRLALSLESNKHYEDSSPWLQKVVYLFSDDEGATWGTPTVVAADPTGRIFNWDQRTAVAPDGAVVSFTWTYDSKAARYLDIHRRISRDDGRTWSGPEPLGFSDQPSRPAIFPDGSVVLAWVDRYGSRSIRARRAAAIDAPFEAGTEVVVHDQAAQSGASIAGTGELLADMGEWSYGLPCAAPLPSGDAIVVYYAGDAQAMEIRWARLR